MQVTVSSGKLKKKGKIKIKSLISTILIFLFAIISTAILISEKKKLIVYEERSFYFVCVGASKKESNLEAKKELLKNLGGANIVYESNGNYNLVANVYLDLESATEIKNNLSTYFDDVSVLTIKNKTITKQNIKKIKKIEECKKFMKFMYNLTNEFYKLQLDYLAGNVSEGKFLANVVEKRLNLEKLCSNISGEDDISVHLRGFGEMILLQTTNFLSGFSIAGTKQNYICNYFVGFFINYVQMFDSL